MTMEAEIGEMCVQAKGGTQPPDLERETCNGVSSRTSRRNSPADNLISDFWTPERFCWCQPPGLWCCVVAAPGSSGRCTFSGAFITAAAASRTSDE